MAKEKILFVAPNLHHGGAEAVLVKILNNINLKKYDINLVLVKKEGSHLKKLRKEINIINLKAGNPISSTFKLWKVIKRVDPDIVFSIIGHINLILAMLKIVSFKSITFIGRENVVYNEWLFKELTLKKRILGVMYKFLLKELDFVIVQSKFMANQVQGYFHVPTRKIVILNNPVESIFIEEAAKEDNLNEAWNREKINLIGIGRIEKVKNYVEMIEIIRSLPTEYHLNIFGEGSETENIKAYISERNLSERITLHGYTENPYKYLKNSFALLLTSERETFPNVILEANACGIYSFSYNMPGGVSEIIINKENGSLINNGNKKEFVQEIIEMQESGYDSKKIKEISDNYSIDKYMMRLYELFEKRN